MTSKVSKKVLIRIFVGSFALVLFFSLIYVFLLTQSPLNNKDEIIDIPKNQQSHVVFNELKEKKIIKSINVLKFFLKTHNEKGEIKAGTYLFKKGSPVYEIARQLYFGIYNIAPIKVVIREGLNNKEISEVLKNSFEDFNEDVFMEKTKDLQGGLFPDTYFLSPYLSVEEIIEEMTNNFNKKIKGLSKEIERTNKSLEEIIVMASLLQGEASGEKDIFLISGILWKRLEKNMLLQVDVDRQTYENPGLPNTPINNPGLLAIKASLNPVDSPYYYYLHDRNREIYFAENHEKHIKNINTYLRNK